MALSLGEVKEAALALSETDRLELLESLSDSLTEFDPAVQRAWMAEAKRRWLAIESGESQTISGDQVLAAGRARLDAQS